MLLISIDGMRPMYVIEAENLGLKLPVLRKFVTDGTYSEGVVNVTPTVTYPNHTTLVTGVLPSEHGIYTNTVFDPSGKEQGAWNWYASQIKTPTLFDAAKSTGLVTGGVLWPVTVHSKSVDYDVPEFWRIKGNESDHSLMEAVSTPNGFLEEAEKTAGPFFADTDEVRLDKKITQTAISAIEKGHPDFLAVHIVSLDGAQHSTGPLNKDAKEDKEVLENIDSMVGEIMAAELKAHPDADVVIASDHGFLPVNHIINLNAAFAKAGLISVTTGGAKPQLQSWKAFAWPSGGSASVVLQDTADQATEEKVNQILTQLAKDPANGIEQVLRGADAAANGALPGAKFVVDSRSGYAMGGNLAGKVIEDKPTTTGTHGYLNTHLEMNSSFFITGTGISKGKNLGKIDMRQIAPTLARELGVELPTAKMEPLPVREKAL